MLIVIPTMGRISRQVTLKNFAGTSMEGSVVLCPPSSERKQYDDLIAMTKVRVAYVPPAYDGISRTREWILRKLSRSMKERYVLMLDDDMDFCYRPDMSDTQLVTIKEAKRLKQMIDLLERWLKGGFVHVGLSARQGNNHIDSAWRDVGRMMNAFAYDTDALMDVTPPVKFGRVPVMEDFDLTLQLLRRGHPNRISYQYCWNQRGSGREGGCSEYRTAKMQRDAAHKLKELHPDFVTVTTKKSKVYWEGLEERTDVNVAWRKAFESSGARYPS
jgi:hypothetical protein